MTRISLKHLEDLVVQINQATGSPAEFLSPEGTPNVGHFHIHVSGFGASLVRVAHVSGETVDVFGAGTLSRTELARMMSAFLLGLNFKKGE